MLEGAPGKKQKAEHLAEEEHEPQQGSELGLVVNRARLKALIELLPKIVQKGKKENKQPDDKSSGGKES